jgi:hypothetical protein
MVAAAVWRWWWQIGGSVAGREAAAQRWRQLSLVENKMVLFGSKFWVSRTVRTLTIAVLGPIATETRRHPFSIPRRPFISNHVSLASRLIVVLTAHLYATVFFVCNRRILSSSPRLPFICTHVFSRFSFDCCMGTVRLLVL